MNGVYVERLRDALECFERSMDVPLVPGDMTAWAKASGADFKQVSEIVRKGMHRFHESQYERMFDEDPALIDRIEQLRREDHRLFDEVTRLDSTMQRFLDVVEHVEPDERKLKEFRESVVRDGLGLVMALRKQEIAVETWYIESLDRDRGNVD